VERGRVGCGISWSIKLQSRWLGCGSKKAELCIELEHGRYAHKGLRALEEGYRDDGRRLCAVIEGEREDMSVIERRALCND